MSGDMLTNTSPHSENPIMTATVKPKELQLVYAFLAGDRSAHRTRRKPGDSAHRQRIQQTGVPVRLRHWRPQTHLLGLRIFLAMASASRAPDEYDVA